MKNKKLAMLLVLVACIWGTIGYKIIAQLNDDVEIKPLRRAKSAQTEDVKTYDLSLAYVDPFLKKRILPVSETKRMISRPVKVVAPPEPVVIIDWSVIQYAGLVFNNSRKIKMASVKVNGNDYFVREGDDIEGFRIADIHSDSIKILFSTSSKYIKRATNN
jgi:hypothetical protein